MMRYGIIDAANLFTRAHYVCSGDAFTKAGMALHIIFNSLNKVYKEKNIDHFVVVGEGRSWRYDHYPEYKAKRILDRKLQSPKEKEEQEVFREVIQELMEFFSEKTRMTIVRMNGAEGDDFIARWTQLHPHDEHVIISADSDNIQLLAPNISIFDGVANRSITLDGVYDANGKPLVFEVNTSSGKLKVGETIAEETKKKLKHDKEKLSQAKKSLSELAKKLKDAQKDLSKSSDPVDIIKNKRLVEGFEKDTAKANLEILALTNEMNKEFSFSPEPEWHRKALFLKLIRGDVGDGIFSANPGVRYKSSKTSVGIEDAWADRHEKGFNWNNFMRKRWTKAMMVDGKEIIQEVQVSDEFQRNEMLIDLTKQPEDIKNRMDETIVEAVQKVPVGNIGLHFARFCKKHDLIRLLDHANDHAKYMGAGYLQEG